MPSSFFILSKNKDGNLALSNKQEKYFHHFHTNCLGKKDLMIDKMYDLFLEAKQREFYQEHDDDEENMYLTVLQR